MGVSKNLHPGQREVQPKGYTRHEVTARRAGGPSGRTKWFPTQEEPASGASAGRRT